MHSMRWTVLPYFVITLECIMSVWARNDDDDDDDDEDDEDDDCQFSVTLKYVFFLCFVCFVEREEERSFIRKNTLFKAFLRLFRYNISVYFSLFFQSNSVCVFSLIQSMYSVYLIQYIQFTSSGCYFAVSWR